MNFLREEWEPWKNLRSVVENNIAPAEPGAYVVRIPGKTVARFLGKDKTGIIDIGETENLRRRLKAFCRSASEGKRGHMACWRFHFLGIGTKYPLNELLVRWCQSKGKKQATAKEAEVMDLYVKKFGELPPLNCKYN